MGVPKSSKKENEKKHFDCRGIRTPANVEPRVCIKSARPLGHVNYLQVEFQTE